MLQQASRWYVYQLIDPRDGKPFYVGKGTGNRLEHHEAEARQGKRSRKTHKILEIWEAGKKVKREKLAMLWDEQAAYDLETDIIQEIGLENLTNVIPGGQTAWVRRVSVRKSQKEIRIKAKSWSEVLGMLAWVIHHSNGLKNWITITHNDAHAGLRNAIGEAIDKQCGNIVEYVRELLIQFVNEVGFDAAYNEMLHYRVQLSKVGEVENGITA